MNSCTDHDRMLIASNGTCSSAQVATYQDTILTYIQKISVVKMFGKFPYAKPSLEGMTCVVCALFSTVEHALTSLASR